MLPINCGRTFKKFNFVFSLFEKKIIFLSGDLSNSPTPNDIQVVRVSLQDSADWKKTIFAPFNIPDGIAGS